MSELRGLFISAKNRLLLLVYVVLVCAFLVYLYMGYLSEHAERLAKIATEDAYLVSQLSMPVNESLNLRVNDARFFANFFARNLDNNRTAALPSDSGNEFEDAVYQEFTSYLAYKQEFNRFAFIGSDGMESAVIRFDGGLPVLLSAAELADKNSWALFQQAMHLEESEVLVKIVDKDFGTNKHVAIVVPVIGQRGMRYGVLALTSGLEHLHEKFLQIQPQGSGRFLLLDDEGALLFDSQQSAGGRDYVKKQNFADMFPVFSEVISTDSSGQADLDNGSFFWRTLPLDTIESHPVSDSSLRLLVHHDQYWLKSVLESMRQRYLLWVISFLGIMVLSFYLITYYRESQMKGETNRQMLQEAREFTSELIEAAFSSLSLEHEMENALEKILSLSWLVLKPQGSIFLTDEDSGDLMMVAQKDLARPLLTSCAVIKPGQCLCGKAASTKKLVYKNCLDHEHEIRFEGMTEHGHICMPILKQDKVLGVLNLYVSHGQELMPIHEDILGSITKALASIIDNKTTHEELMSAHHDMRRQHQELDYERLVVEDTLLKIRKAEQFDEHNIRYLESSVEKTAGDVLLSSASNNGIHHYLLGDFTGHGLASALSGPTVADIFYAMSRKGFDALKILQTINDKLVRTLPVHLYLAACMVEFDTDKNTFKIFNAGVPSALLFRDNLLHQEFVSRLLPLGIIQDQDFAASMETYSVLPGDRLYVYSDGITEAPNLAEEMYGQERFVALLQKIQLQQLPVETVLDDVMEFTRYTNQADDITLVEIFVSDS